MKRLLVCVFWGSWDIVSPLALATPPWALGCMFGCALVMFWLAFGVWPIVWRYVRDGWEDD